jgi:pimeloyl-ACP methyl ester carboxylesterase
VYAIHVPVRRDPSRAARLVLALHYAVDRHRNGRASPGRRFLMELALPGLRNLDAILVAPDCPGETWTTPATERALVELTRVLHARHGVTAARSAVVGYSLGGSGAWFMLARHPELFSASIPVASRPEGAWVDAITRGAVCAIQSRADEHVPFEAVGDAVRALRARGLPAELVAVDGLLHGDARSFADPLGRASRWLEGVWED